MIYNNFIETISTKFRHKFEEISTVYNFDNGDEFEIALCKALRTVLPQTYGICRGFIITQENEIVGDDIIIYDQLHFPTLRLLEDNTFAQKQQIPFEAVYAYIEAKSTIIIEGNGGNTLNKAIDQCAKVKSLKREDVPYSKYIINSIPLNKPLQNWPKIANPIYTAIVSNGIRETKNSQISSSFINTLEILKVVNSDKDKTLPDLIIADVNTLFIPLINNTVESPFMINKVSNLGFNHSKGMAYGIGLSYMFYAFENIKLGQIHWPKIISESMNVECK